VRTSRHSALNKYLPPRRWHQSMYQNIDTPFFMPLMPRVIKGVCNSAFRRLPKPPSEGGTTNALSSFPQRRFMFNSSVLWILCPLIITMECSYPVGKYGAAETQNIASLLSHR
ncbi:MAG TPA: hypothetical protein VIC84_22225, partial [Blastocatellia bacterium]